MEQDIREEDDEAGTWTEPDGDWEASHPDQCSAGEWAAHLRHSGWRR